MAKTKQANDPCPPVGEECAKAEDLKSLKAEVDSQGRELSNLAALLTRVVDRVERRIGALDLQTMKN